MEKFFELKKHGTTVRTEVMAGLTTFFAMAYILVVNPMILSEGAGIVGEDAAAVLNGVFFATCLSSFIGTMLMAVYAKIPFAQAPGMGLNAFFAYTVMAGAGYSYDQALGIVFISGLLFVLMTVTGFREMIIECIPKNIKIAISAGIGLFLALLGFANAGIVVANPATLVSLANFTSLANPAAAPEAKAAATAALLALIGLLLIAVLAAWKIRGAILIGILATTVIGIPMGVTALPDFSINIGRQFGDFVNVSLFGFARGLGGLFGGQSFWAALSNVIILVISFSLVDMFDTIGTLLGTANRAGLLRKDGKMERMNEALLSDSVATVAGAMLGTSTVTTYVESAAGIGEGGRSGLTAFTTAILFLVAIVLAPFVGMIPSAATAPALIYVGCLMIASIRNVDWDDMSEAVPAFLTVAIMPMTYSIANGIAFGLISYVVIKICSAKSRDVHPLAFILSVLFVARFLLMAM